MVSDWQEFLAAQGAVIADGRVLHFARPTTTNGNIIADLSHLGLLQISGNDALNFLQGQLTNDMKSLADDNAHYAAHCNPKGRMLAIFLAFTRKENFYLQVNGALREAAMKRLKMYVLRAKVVIEDKSDGLIRLGVAGEKTVAALREIFGDAPQEPLRKQMPDGATLLRLPGAIPRFEIFTRPENARKIWSALAPICAPVGGDVWEWHEIRAGIPDIFPATQEAFVPQMLNLDAIGGISFKKGCYTGQEIVARTHYLGKIKRRMCLGHVECATAPQAGDHIFGTDSAEPVGMTVRAAPAPQGGFDLLYEARLESLEAGALKLGNANGAEIQALALPYAI
ncbi:MAG: folate-binding protein YgfZ [Methylobacillus sp.]|nr:folate-binding protein YgfZ [Methylobacillus sp.]